MSASVRPTQHRQHVSDEQPTTNHPATSRMTYDLLHERIYWPGLLPLCLYLTFGFTHGVGYGKREL
jgi:hypothetical protein